MILHTCAEAWGRDVCAGLWTDAELWLDGTNWRQTEERKAHEAKTKRERQKNRVGEAKEIAHVNVNIVKYCL